MQLIRQHCVAVREKSCFGSKQRFHGSRDRQIATEDGYHTQIGLQLGFVSQNPLFRMLHVDMHMQNVELGPNLSLPPAYSRLGWPKSLSCSFSRAVFVLLSELDSASHLP